MAQLVARSVRDAEVARSSRVTQTIFAGISAVVARTPGGREVGSSILLSPTRNQDGEAIFFERSEPTKLCYTYNICSKNLSSPGTFLHYSILLI